MPDAYGMPTPEERLLARLREQSQQAATMGRGQAAPQMSPATTPGMLTPEQMQMAARNLRPRENQLDQQQSMAMNLMNSPSAKGIQPVTSTPRPAGPHSWPAPCGRAPVPTPPTTPARSAQP